MVTSLEQIQAKIAELEAKLINLKIAEREVQTLEKGVGRQTKALGPKAKPSGKVAKTTKAVTNPESAAKPQQTIGGAITEVLQEHGMLAAKAIASAIQASGKDINNRAVSFALQAMKKRGLVKSAGGEWSLKGRAKR